MHLNETHEEIVLG